MAYDETLAARVRPLLDGAGAVVEKKMFGALSFMVDDTLVVSVSKDGGLLVRSTVARAAELVDEEHVAYMAMGKNVSDSWVEVDAAGLTTDEGLSRWVEIGLSAARSG